ncbi:erythromycin esterase family protein [Zunongwangia endophytica]|uniref:Erythromycin esterase family protein n=1 Tax=Zunongwangia endophytica TaxID=1808945 RepID=A0ABV8H3G8_9FLAO|nr:erythromycin esterase family protein [Zunongwangia endophytica]MDN3595827.1 erythromycin esterase family protein [Zunongwangia endophytica]
MTRIFTLALLMLSFIINAQQLKTIPLLAPGSNTYDNLDFLKEKLQDKNIVMLGEQTHMYASIFEMKIRIIEYLHQELGYNTIAMESPIYDIWKMNQTGFEPYKFNKAIWGVWGNNEEFQRLVNYIETNDLKVIGVDSQVMNTSNFTDDFFDFIEENNLRLKLDENDLGIIIEGILENSTFDDSDLNFSQFKREIESIIRQIEKRTNTETNYYWVQFTKSLLASANDVYENSKPILSEDFINKQHNFRDAQMADNLISYVERNPKEKIIVWADNIHIMLDNSSINEPIIGGFISAGTYIKEKLRDNVYSLATIHANDSLYDDGRRKWEKTPIKTGSFEDILRKKQADYLFIDAHQKAMDKSYDSRLLSFINFYELRLNEFHDGYIFLKQATLPKSESKAITKAKEDTITESKIASPKAEKEKSGKIITLKGKLIDATNNEAVAFANLIMKEEQIYRVADENGHFELSVNERMFKESSVEISSMGYKSKIIALEELQKEIQLEPSFESLAEVVISAHLTPISVLKKAVKAKYKNHTKEDFNYQRYSHIILNAKDTTFIDVDLITANHDNGFKSENRTTKRVEQIRWNKNLAKNVYKNTWQFFSFREDPIRYANILHKRKYKKFDLEFVSSGLAEDKGNYIIAFRTSRNKWNYTNRGYPTAYSGKVYIDKASFAIIKVVENWETHLDEKEVEKHYSYRRDHQDEKSLIIKEENIAYYNKIYNGKHYPSKYLRRNYKEGEYNNGKKVSNVFEIESYLYDYEFEDVEEINYEYFGKEEQTLLNRIDYDPEFWNDFESKTLKN